MIQADVEVRYDHAKLYRICCVYLWQYEGGYVHGDPQRWFERKEDLSR